LFTICTTTFNSIYWIHENILPAIWFFDEFDLSIPYIGF